MPSLDPMFVLDFFLDGSHLLKLNLEAGSTFSSRERDMAGNVFSYRFDLLEVEGWVVLPTRALGMVGEGITVTRALLDLRQRKASMQLISG